MNKATKAVLFTLAIFVVIFLIASNAATLAAVGLVVGKYATLAVGGSALVASPVKLLPYLAALL